MSVAAIAAPLPGAPQSRLVAMPGTSISHHGSVGVPGSTPSQYRTAMSPASTASQHRPVFLPPTPSPHQKGLRSPRSATSRHAAVLLPATPSHHGTSIATGSHPATSTQVLTAFPVALQAADALQPLRQEEAWLLSMVESQKQQIARAQERVRFAASEPDPLLHAYTQSLQESVTLEQQAKAAGEAAEEARARRDVAEEDTRKRHAEVVADRGRIADCSAKLQLIFQENERLQRTIVEAELRMAQARAGHMDSVARRRADVAAARARVFSVEREMVELDTAQSRLAAEVKWYDDRCAELEMLVSDSWAGSARPGCP